MAAPDSCDCPRGCITCAKLVRLARWKIDGCWYLDAAEVYGGADPGELVLLDEALATSHRAATTMQYPYAEYEH